MFSILTEFESNEEICSQKIEEWISNTQMLDHKEKEYEERILTGKTRINNVSNDNNYKNN